MAKEREILFRGRVTATGEWRIGCYCSGFDSKAEPTPYIGNINHRGVVVFAAVDPETVGQFTGALDREGRKIFEGDVLSIELDDGSTDLLTIHYEDMAFMGYVPSVPAGIDPEVPISEYLLAKYYKVVGNIFDDAELLEVRL